MAKFKILVSVTTCEEYEVEAPDEETAEGLYDEGEGHFIRSEPVEAIVVQTDKISD